MKKVVIGALATFLFMLLLSSVALAAGYQTGGFGATPHSGYASTSSKCKVCHAVHDATAGGKILLQSTVVNNACNYCHITTTTSNVHPYGNVETNYTQDVRWNHNSGQSYAGGQNLGLVSGYVGTTVSCTQCHSVHGANTVSIGLTTIAKKNPSGVAGADATGTGATLESTFCANCHRDSHYSTSYNGAPTAPYTGYSHIQNATINNYSNSAKSDSSLTQVAWTASDYCSGCHKEGKTGKGTLLAYTGALKSFPHIYSTAETAGATTAGAYQWLDTTNYAGSSATPTLIDAPCLNCHRTGAATGVGYTF